MNDDKTPREYEWTGVVPVWEGRGHKRGEVVFLTEAAAARLVAAKAIELKSDADKRRAAETRAETRGTAQGKVEVN